MDIKAQMEQILEKIKTDKELKKMFTEDPERAVEKTLGVDIPDELVPTIIEGVKAKLGAEKAGGLLGSVMGMLDKQEQGK